jgi:hypothetical protein
MQSKTAEQAEFRANPQNSRDEDALQSIRDAMEQKGCRLHHVAMLFGLDT